MTTYKNINFTKRNYDCTNIVACVAESAPNENWVECDESVLDGLMKLHSINGVAYYGYL